MRRAIHRIWFLGLLALAATQPAWAERRVALVVGNASYTSRPLKNPVNDATAVAEVLKKLDFDVQVETNLDKVGMEEALRRFARLLPDADVALFYYSGHAVQVNGRNYLIPVSAQLTDANTTLDTIALQDVNGRLEGAGVKTRLLFLDACRDNPFGTALGSGTTRGLAKADAKTAVSGGTLLAFSTSPDDVAFDGDTLLSPFTDAFVRFAATPKLEIQGMLDKVSADVVEKTHHQQVPWRNASALNFFLVPHRPPPVFDASVTVSVAPDTPTPLHLTTPVQIEGGAIRVALVRLPNAGDLLLGDRKITTEETIAADEFARLSYRPAPQAPAADAFSFRVSDAWGNEGDGIVTLLRGGAVPVAAVAPPALGSLQSRGISLLGLGPNLKLTEKAPVAAPTQGLRLQLASDPSFGQLVLGDRVIEKGRSISMADLDHIAFLPPAGSEGRQLDALFRPAAASGEIRLAIQVAATDCDRLAGEPLDAQGVSAGVLQGHIDVAAALPACEHAASVKPDSGRFAYQLARVYASMGRSTDAFRLYQRASELGHVRALQKLGYAHTFGFGTATDVARGRQELEAAMAKGDVQAMHSLAGLYHIGKGVPKDVARARALFEQAARVGLTSSMNALAGMYQRGDGVPVDLALTRRYLEAAAARGDVYGIQNLGVLELEGIGTPKNFAKAMGYFRQAYDLGHPTAPNFIGHMYLLGQGVAKDAEEARKWFAVGSDRGDGMASLNLGDVSLGGAPDTTERAAAALYYARAAAFKDPDAARQGRQRLLSLDRGSKLQALRTLVSRLDPSLRLPGSEPTLLTLAGQLAARQEVRPDGPGLDDVLVATARAEWQARNPRTDLF